MPELSKPSKLKLANNAMREGNYELALRLYWESIDDIPELENTYRFNIELTQKKIRATFGSGASARALTSESTKSNKSSSPWKKI